MSAKTMEIVEKLKSLNSLETSQLVKQIEVTFNVDASARKTVNILPVIIDPIWDEPEETVFDVILEEFPSEQKIAVLKVIRSLTGFGLKEAKDLVDSVPQAVKFAIALPEAEDIKRQLEAVGAKVSLK